MGNKKFYQVFYNGKEYRTGIGSIVELRDDFEDYMITVDVPIIEQIRQLKNNIFHVVNYELDEFGDCVFILDDLTYKENHQLSQTVILRSQYFIPSVTGMRKHKLKKIMGNG